MTGGAVLDDSLTGADLAGGVATGAITPNSGFVANGRCRDFDVTVAGARVGDAVTFSVNGDVPDGILLYGVRVSQPDIVLGKACNLSGGTFPQLNALPVAIVTVSPAPAGYFSRSTIIASPWPPATHIVSRPTE